MSTKGHRVLELLKHIKEIPDITFTPSIFTLVESEREAEKMKILENPLK